MTAIGRLKYGHRQSIEGQRVNRAAAGLSQHDYACRAALYRRVGQVWLCMSRHDTVAEAIKESQSGDVVWWHHRGRKWVPFVKCV